MGCSIAVSLVEQRCARTYISTTRRMTSGDELKQRNGDTGLRGRDMRVPVP